MSQIKLYTNKTSAIGDTVTTPAVCVLKGVDNCLYIPMWVGDTAEIIEDGDFIKYEDYADIMSQINGNDKGHATTLYPDTLLDLILTT